MRLNNFFTFIVGTNQMGFCLYLELDLYKKAKPLQQVCQIENSEDSDVKCHKEFNFKLNFQWKENGNLILLSRALSLSLWV
jgi:hypothetical protein